MIRSALLAITLAACSGGSPAPAETTAPLAPPRVASPPPLAPSERGPSIYELPVELRDAADRTIGLDVHRGRPVLVTMFYASCSIACPLLISEVARVVDELPADVQDDVRVLMISFDPVRDTAAKLATLARERKLDDRWTLAVASAPDARALAAVLGIRYRELANGEFAHGSTIVALDEEGRPIGRTDALGIREPLQAALIGL